jgi:hypothetical protein
MNDELDEAVNDILSQLKNTSVIKHTPVTDTLTKEKLEEFLIKNSGKLVTDSINLIDDMRDFVGTADADPDSISALAELIKAASSAVDTLNKIYISDERNKNQVKIKTMDIESREKLSIMDNQTKVLLSREDIMKAIIDKEVIDI